MARQFTLGVVALAVLAQACGESKPRVQDIPDQSATPTTSASPTIITPAVASEPVQPEVTGPVSFSDGETAFQERRYEQAVALFIAYTTQHPDNAWGYYMLGLSEWKAGRPERAAAAFEIVLSKDSTHRKTWLNLSRVLLESGKAEDALVHAERAVQTDSGNAEGWRLVGRARVELGRGDEAIQAYRHALALDERDVWSMNNIGMIYLQSGRFSEALPPLARATELNPERSVFQNNLGLVLERLGQVTAAATAYRAAIAADSMHAKATQSLARVENRTQQADVMPVDLAALAKSFADEIGRWKQEMAVVVNQ